MNLVHETRCWLLRLTTINIDNECRMSDQVKNSSKSCLITITICINFRLKYFIFDSSKSMARQWQWQLLTSSTCCCWEMAEDEEKSNLWMSRWGGFLLSLINNTKMFSYTSSADRMCAICRLLCYPQQYTQKTYPGCSTINSFVIIAVDTVTV